MAGGTLVGRIGAPTTVGNPAVGRITVDGKTQAGRIQTAPGVKHLGPQLRMDMQVTTAHRLHLPTKVVMNFVYSWKDSARTRNYVCN